ncbi:MAG: RHS repeat-associated core domain-containing protein [bacterium]
MNNFNVLRSNSKGFGANLTDFYRGQLETLDRLVDSKDSDETYLNPDDIVLDTIAPYDNTIFSKQNLGPYKYTYHNDTLSYAANLPKPKNAVKQIETSTDDLSKFRQVLTYTSFNSVKTIKDTIIRSMGVGNPPDSVELTKTFYYGADGQRVLMVSKENNVITAKKYYIGEYEYIDSVEANRIKEVTYISAPTGLVAAEVKIDTIPTFYYILTDHLGSITQLLHSNGDPVTNARFTYDAWGRLRDLTNTANPYLPNTDQTIAFHILDRGYCGHEHLLDHGIINMNGRIYDPTVGQFMQADNYIQTPEDYIGYNRYSYCRHNPFKYTDPSGEQLVHSPGPSDGTCYSSMEESLIYFYASLPSESLTEFGKRFLKFYNSIYLGGGGPSGVGGWDSDDGGGGNSGGVGANDFSGGSGKEGSVVTLIKNAWNTVKGWFKKSDPKGDTKTSTANYVEVKNFKGGKQPPGNTCGLQCLSDDYTSNNIQVPYADVELEYIDQEKQVKPLGKGHLWETQGEVAGILINTEVTIKAGLLRAPSICDQAANTFRYYIDRNYSITCGIWEVGAPLGHWIKIYAYQGDSFYYWDTRDATTQLLPSLNNLKMLYSDKYGQYYGIPHYIRK